MSQAIEKLMSAIQKGLQIRPKVGGFPYFAEVLRSAGVKKNIWSLPSCQSIYLTTAGAVVMEGKYLINNAVDIPAFSCEALIKALRTDQEGKGTFPEFLEAAWKAGVVRYEVDFEKRYVTYYGCLNEEYIE